MKSLVQHLHDFAREVELTDQEWMSSLMFLTEVGQICSPVRQEFILLSDVLGLSALVDSQAKKVPSGATQPTILGPFQTADAEEVNI
jgi:hydroxyquinol 1,2-dioxygenase